MVTVVHAKVSTIPDDPVSVARGEVVPSDWNEDHTITGLTADDVAYVPSGGMVSTTVQNAIDELASIAGTLQYYWTNTASDIATYYKQTIAGLSSIQTISTAGATNGQLLATFASEPNNPNRTFIPDGQYSCHIHAAKTAGTKDASVRAEIWEVNSSGTDIAKIADLGPSTNLTGSSAEYFIAEAVARYALSGITSRLVTKIYAVVSGGGSAPTIALYAGNGSDSRTNFPAPALDVTNYVPYTNATSDVDLGSKSLGLTGSIGATAARVLKGWFTDLQVTNAIAGSITGNAATVTTNANLTGDVTSTGNATTLTAATVTGKALTGFSSGAGTIAATDTILQGFNKADGNIRSMLGEYQVLCNLVSSQTASIAVGTYTMGYQRALNATTSPAAVIPIYSADFATVTGLAPKLRIRMQVCTNATAPTASFRAALFPISNTAGAASNITYTLGAEVSGSTTTTVTTPAANSRTSVTGSDFALPSDGMFVMCIVQSTATTAASSFTAFTVQLQFHHA